MTNIKVEPSTPCLDPTVQTRPSTGKLIYPLELARDLPNACPTLKQFSEADDTRYQDLGSPSVTEKEIQQTSGVLDKLKTLPLYSQYVSDEAKEAVNYRFWAKPTIPWRLSCESTNPKDKVVQAAN